MPTPSRLLDLVCRDGVVRSLCPLPGSRLRGWPGGGSTRFDAVDHEAVAEDVKAKGHSAISLLVFMSPLREELFDDPRHAVKSTVIMQSEIDHDIAFHTGVRSPPLADEILAEARDIGIDVEGAIATGIAEGRQRVEVEDAILEGMLRTRILRHYPDAIAERRRTFRTHDPATGRRRREPLKGDELARAWSRELSRLLAPRTEHRYSRISPLAAPFDGKSSWQQYFLAGGDGEIIMARGSSEGSGTRHTQGRMAHTFALLQDMGYERFEGTYIIHVDRENQARLLGHFRGLRTTWLELSGNYPSSRAVIDELFRGKLATFDHDSASLIVE